MKKASLVCGIFCAFLVLISCGKVTQDSSPKSVSKEISFSYQVPVIPTPNIRLDAKLKAHNSPFLIDEDIYVSVSRYDVKRNRKELSWGKGVAEIEKVTSGDAKPLFLIRSRAYDKRGLELKKISDLGRSKWAYDDKKQVWNGDSKKIKKGFPFYLISTYTRPYHYRLKWVDEETISNNTTLSLGGIEPYDTFFAVMNLHLIADKLISKEDYGSLLHIFDYAFFQKLDYVFPENLTKRFSYESPVFKFRDPLIDQLLTLFDIALVDVEQVTKEINALDKSVLNEAAKSVLIRNIERWAAETSRGRF